jgi:hypothetical protein
MEEFTTMIVSMLLAMIVVLKRIATKQERQHVNGVVLACTSLTVIKQHNHLNLWPVTSVVSASTMIAPHDPFIFAKIAPMVSRLGVWVTVVHVKERLLDYHL